MEPRATGLIRFTLPHLIQQYRKQTNHRRSLHPHSDNKLLSDIVQHAYAKPTPWPCSSIFQVNEKRWMTILFALASWLIRGVGGHFSFFFAKRGKPSGVFSAYLHVLLFAGLVCVCFYFICNLHVIPTHSGCPSFTHYTTVYRVYRVFFKFKNIRLRFLMMFYFARCMA